MTFSGPSAFQSALPPEGADACAAHPPEIAFLLKAGVSSVRLAQAAALAQAQAIAPEAALLAAGDLSETFFYAALANHLGVAFAQGAERLGRGARYPRSILAGVAPLAGPGPRWLVAPRGPTLSSLLRRRARGETLGESLVVTTPSRLSRLLQQRAAPLIAEHASLALADRDPALCARDGITQGQSAAAVSALVLFALGAALIPILARLYALGAGLAFLAAIMLRLASCAASVAPRPARAAGRIEDRLLPPYSIVVALHNEARVVGELVRAIDAIDYPRAKLDIKLVVEAHDEATRNALAELGLPPHYEILTAPPGAPQTKPRALNVALPLLSGRFVAVFDAEDAPDPGQLRAAVARFFKAPERVACLQAQLAIDNVDDSWLTRLYAIEYAALFDVATHGLARLRWPIPLGGTSNHFRVAALRRVSGWDAWNVTEDADLGLRLARFGYRCETVVSTTREEAPARLGAWMRQRRRWSKGWMQTFVTLSRDPARLGREVGLRGLVIYALMTVNLCVGPLLWPFFGAALARDLWRFGPPAPESLLSLVEATLWTSVAGLGAVSVLWAAALGMRRRRLLGLWPFLPLLMPYHLLVAAAGWAALYDLCRRPFHWHKTEHGLARSSRARTAQTQADQIQFEPQDGESPAPPGPP